MVQGKDPTSFFDMEIRNFPKIICLRKFSFPLYGLGTLIEDHLLYKQKFISRLSILFCW